MSQYFGDYTAGATVRIPFDTAAAAGSRVDFSGALEVADILIYKDAGATERSSTSGYTVSGVGGFDSKVGAHFFTVDLSDNTDAGFFAAGHDYSVLLYPDETVDSLAVAKWIGSFSIENRYNIVASVTGAVGSVTGNVGGNVVGSVASVTGNVGGNVVGTVASVVGSVGSVTGAVGSVTGNVGGNVVGSVGSVTTVTDKTGYALTSGERTSIATAVTVNQAIETGTASSVTGTGLTLAGTFETNALIGAMIEIETATTGSKQSRIITANTASAITVDAWAPSLTGTVTYTLWAGPPAVTAATVAAAVRTELAPEMAWIDVATSTRSDITQAQVNTECDTALADIGLTSAVVTKVDGALPAASAGSNGGLPTVDANNRIAGIVGTITTLDALDTAQDSQHATTQGKVDVVDDLLDTEMPALTTAVGAVKTKTDFLPSATAGAAGGVFIAGSNAATTVNVTGNITGNLSGSVGSVTGAVGSVTGAVGSVTGSVGSVTGAVGSVTGNVGGNVVGTVASVVGNVGGNVVGSVASVTADVSLETAEYAAIADKILGRHIEGGADGTRTVTQALQLLRNKRTVDRSALTFEVKAADDSTTSWSGTLAVGAGSPINTVDPA